MLANGGIYPERKRKTDKIKNYLIATSASLYGEEEWERRFQCQLATVDHTRLPTQNFVDFARIIACHPKEVFLTPKIIIDDLQAAIFLRKRESLKHKRANFATEEDWRKYQQHLDFEAKLEEISRIFADGIANHIRMMVSKLVQGDDAKPSVSHFAKLTTALPTEADSDSEAIQTSFSQADGDEKTVNNGGSLDPPGLLEAILDLMAH
jgi:hypothetical protein